MAIGTGGLLQDDRRRHRGGVAPHSASIHVRTGAAPQFGDLMEVNGGVEVVRKDALGTAYWLHTIYCIRELAYVLLARYCSTWMSAIRSRTVWRHWLALQHGRATRMQGGRVYGAIVLCGPAVHRIAEMGDRGVLVRLSGPNIRRPTSALVLRRFALPVKRK